MQNKQNTLVKLNMPTSYPPFPTQGTDYDVEVYIKNFEEAKAELPEEVTVLRHFLPEDYPRSMANELFVAEDGDDENDGTKEAPFATVKKALSVLKARGAKGGVIRMREGSYSEQITLGAETATEADAPLFLIAAPGEKVQFHGAFTLKGSDFAPVTDAEARKKLGVNADKVLVADLNKVGIDAGKIAKIVPNQTPMLCVDGEAGILARFPNKPKIPNDFSDMRDQRKEGGIKETSFSRVNDEEESPLHIVFDKNDVTVGDWELTDDMWMGGSLFFEWTSWHWRIAKIDGEENSITTESYNMWKRHEAMHWRPSNEMYFYNFLEGLDEPKEWFLDRKTGMLYYYPTETFTPDSVVQLVGEERETAILVENTGNVVVSNFDIGATNGNCVVVRECHDVVIDNCRFANCSSRGATIFTNCSRSGVIYSEYVGRGYFCHGADERRADLVPTNNFFQNNLCHKYEAQIGVGIQNGVGDIVSHNHLIDCGVTPGWSNELVIEYNEFDGGPYRGIDTGYIYCVGANFGSRAFHIRYNYFHGNKTCLCGVYLDIHSGGHYIYGNVIRKERIYKGTNGISNSHCSIVTNNIILNARRGFEGNTDDLPSGRIAYFKRDIEWAEKMGKAFWDRHTQLRFMIDGMKEELARSGGDEANVELTERTKLLRWCGFHPTYRNVFVNVDHPTENGEEFHRVCCTKFDTNLISEGDVGFVDYENKNYRLKPDSIVYDKIPAWEEIPLDKVGIVK